MKSISVFACLVGSIFLPALAWSDPGDPVAIRHLPKGGFAIETMWNFSVVISGNELETRALEGVDIVSAALREEAEKGRFIADSDTQIDHVLDRPANQLQPTWQPFDESAKRSANAVRVRSFGKSAVVVDVDGVRISYRYLDDPASGSRSWQSIPPAASSLMADSDVMLYATGGSEDELIKTLEEPSEGIGQIIIAGSESGDGAVGNTFAVRSPMPKEVANGRIVRLSRKAVQLPKELAELMEKKEAACEASQKVFAALSINQMNFRPSNGSHTPRWNAEHMMGRELVFFSQIFSKQDPAIPVMDLNPKQMPPDYVARHADWTGVEEARQMERVSALTRRFAYLIRDLPLDKKAPGSNWTPRALLRQMDRHYSEHTANVKKKFELDDWPIK